MTYIPIVTEKTQQGEIHYDIFSRLLKERIILLNNEINGIAATIGIIVAPINTKIIVLIFFLSISILVLYPDKNIKKIKPN